MWTDAWDMWRREGGLRFSSAVMKIFPHLCVCGGGGFSLRVLTSWPQHPFIK